MRRGGEHDPPRLGVDHWPSASSSRHITRPRDYDIGRVPSDAVTTGVIDPWTTELIVVDDGSTDETACLAQELLAPAFPELRILRLGENSGKGAAVRVGAAAAAAPVVAFMDADMSVDPAQLPNS